MSNDLKLIIRGCSNFVRILIALSANIFEKRLLRCCPRNG